MSLTSSIALRAQETVKCRIETKLGNVDLVLYADKAPITVNNFLKYVDDSLYTNSSFFRVCTPENEAGRDVKIEVIQGGNLADEAPYEPIEIETTEQTGLQHRDGTISMARSGPNTATSQFFICIGDQPELDFKGRRNPDGFGFAAFGEVTQGMEIVRQIQQGDNKNQRLLNPIKIISITRLFE
jgi:peptidyl-prolyl cis-trans isomerase A (cyclophilin A)